ncbi:unnamed protein product, partial [Rotaria magnacalcarata]
ITILSMFSPILSTGVIFNGSGTKFILTGVELPMLLLLTNGGRGVRGTPPLIILAGTFGNTAEIIGGATELEGGAKEKDGA